MVWEKYLDYKTKNLTNKKNLETKEIELKTEDIQNEIRNSIITGNVDIFSGKNPKSSDFIKPIRLDTGIYVPNFYIKENINIP